MYALKYAMHTATKRKESICCGTDPDDVVQAAGISNAAGLGSVGVNDSNSNVMEMPLTKV